MTSFGWASVYRIAPAHINTHFTGVDVLGSSASPATSNLLQLKAQAAFTIGHGTPLTSQKQVRGEKEYLARIIRHLDKGWKLIEGGLAAHKLPEWFEQQVGAA
jgi:hypothetical protein